MTQALRIEEPAGLTTSYRWVLLPNSPVASSRTDDIWFFDDLTGWLVDSSGYVCKTEDAGNSWILKFFLYPDLPSKPYLRCMSWANRKIGWFGAVTGIDVHDVHDPSRYIRTLLHHTTDGGETWSAVKNLPEGSPGGICGFHAVNEEVAYGSGTNDPGLPGPAIIKTTDNGDTWELIPMQEHADNLIDVFFTDADHGWVVGGKIDPDCTVTADYPEPRLSRYGQLRAVVLRTEDGGRSWTNQAAATENLACGEWGWKIQFLDDRVGFVALENFRDAAILKTTDGGETWVRKHVAKNQDPSSPPINNDLEGIGFINESQGWVGGWGNNFAGLMNSYTEDGGETWIPEDHVPGDPDSDPRTRINRYRFVGQPVSGGYCSGQQVFKLGHKKTAFGRRTAVALGTMPRLEPAHSDEVLPLPIAHSRSTATIDPDHGFDLDYERSRDGTVRISYTLPENARNVFVGLWSKFAFHVRTLVSEPEQGKGRRTVVWDGKDDGGDPVGAGPYICRMCTAGAKGASRLIELRPAF